MTTLRRALSIVAASALAATASAQTVGAIHGTVVDQTGHGVENAQVVLTPGSRTAITLDDGHFTIANITDGVYTLTARRIGYTPTTMRVGVRDSTSTVTVWLNANAAQLEAIRIQEKSLGLHYTGVVLDQNNLPVTNADVAAMGVDDHLKTDSLGRFTVPKLARGALVLRIRKIGYAAYVNSFRILADRADTLRMQRLATTLSAVEIKERSGYGFDQGAYEELAARVRWKPPTAAMISREELAQQGSVNLCEAIPLTPNGAQRVPISNYDCQNQLFRVLLNGTVCEQTKLTGFMADNVETIEYYPPRAVDIQKPPGAGAERPPKRANWVHGYNTGGTDVAETLSEHSCPAEVFVIWTRQDVQADSQAVVKAELLTSVGDTGRLTKLHPVEGRDTAALHNPSHLQGQVVDSAGKPLRSALVYTTDPLYATLTDKSGFFRLNELPSGAMTVRAEHSGYVPIEFQLRLPPDTTVGVGLKLVRAATRMGTVQIDTASGTQGRVVRVIAENGQPIMFANITLEGATMRITDEKGEVSLGAGKRQTFSVRVSRIGFAPWFGKVDLPSAATMTVTLPQIAQVLAPVTVSGAQQIKSPLQLTGFYDRWLMREKGTLSATFIGPEELEFRHPAKITSMLGGLNGVRVMKLNGIGGMEDNLVAYSTASSSVQQLCPMAILIDGQQERPPVFIDRVLDAGAVMAIEVYERGGNMPIGLQADDNACGVVAFWTGSRR